MSELKTKNTGLPLMAVLRNLSVLHFYLKNVEKLLFYCWLSLKPSLSSPIPRQDQVKMASTLRKDWGPSKVIWKVGTILETKTSLKYYAARAQHAWRHLETIILLKSPPFKDDSIWFFFFFAFSAVAFLEHLSRVITVGETSACVQVGVCVLLAIKVRRSYF